MAFPVDECNLSFSKDKGMSSIFITQSTFMNVNIQQVSDAVDFLDNLGDVSVQDVPHVDEEEVKQIIK